MESYYGAEEAHRRFTALYQIVHDKVGFRQAVAQADGISVADAKRKLSIALNKEYISTKYQKLRELVASRQEISKALQEHPYVKAKSPSSKHEKGDPKYETSLLSKRLQCLEGFALDELEKQLELHGLKVDIVVADGLYCRPKSSEFDVYRAVEDAEKVLGEKGLNMKFGVMKLGRV